MTDLMDGQTSQLYVISPEQGLYSFSLTFTPDTDGFDFSQFQRQGGSVSKRYSQNWIESNYCPSEERNLLQRTVVLSMYNITLQRLLEVFCHFTSLTIETSDFTFRPTFVRAVNDDSNQVSYCRLIKKHSIDTSVSDNRTINFFEVLDVQGNLTSYHFVDPDQNYQVLDLIEMSQLIAGLTSLVEQSQVP